MSAPSLECDLLVEDGVSHGFFTRQGAPRVAFMPASMAGADRVTRRLPWCKISR